MPIKYSQALLIALAMTAAPAFAQDTPPAQTGTAPAETAAPEAAAPEAAATEAQPAEASPATDAAPAEAAAADGAAPAAETTQNAEPQVGQYYVKSTNGDWTTRCIKADQGKDPCELYQLLKDSDGNSVAEMTLIPIPSSSRNSRMTALRAVSPNSTLPPSGR